MPKCKYFFLKPNDIFCLFCTISTRPQRIKYCYVHLTVLSSPFHFDSTICVSAKIKNYSTMPQFVYLSLLCGLNVWFVEFGARTEPNRTEKNNQTQTQDMANLLTKNIINWILSVSTRVAVVRVLCKIKKQILKVAYNIRANQHKVLHTNTHTRRSTHYKTKCIFLYKCRVLYHFDGIGYSLRSEL